MIGDLYKEPAKLNNKKQNNPVKNGQGTSLVVQWVRLCAPNAGCLGSIPGQGTKSCVHATTKKKSSVATESLHAATIDPACRH